MSLENLWIQNWWQNFRIWRSLWVFFVNFWANTFCHLFLFLYFYWCAKFPKKLIKRFYEELVTDIPTEEQMDTRRDRWTIEQAWIRKTSTPGSTKTKKIKKLKKILEKENYQEAASSRTSSALWRNTSSIKSSAVAKRMKTPEIHEEVCWWLWIYFNLLWISSLCTILGKMIP